MKEWNLAKSRDTLHPINLVENFSFLRFTRFCIFQFLRDLFTILIYVYIRAIETLI